ncbi:pyrroline-5-carboxylate reductase family protein [Rossellomorea sp. H39__3]
MPNTSAALGKSATAVTLDRFGDRVMKEAVVHLLDSVGLTVEVEEHQLDLITALSGSGPAYIYDMAEMMQATAVELGLPSELARDLTIRTITGAGAMLEESGLDAEELRKNVTSPGGTTEAGIEALKAHGVEHALFDCISSARNRSEELGRKLIKTEKD